VQDKPSADELLDALAAFLETKVVPAFEGRDRFHALVGANVARIVARELRLAPAQCRDEYDALCGLLGETPTDSGPSTAELLRLNAELCRRIDDGDADHGEFRRRVREFLRRTVVAKLAVDNPKLLGER
jgi:hypothetical protein